MPQRKPNSSIHWNFEFKQLNEQFTIDFNFFTLNASARQIFLGICTQCVLYTKICGSNNKIKLDKFVADYNEKACLQFNWN